MAPRGLFMTANPPYSLADIEGASELDAATERASAPPYLGETGGMGGFGLSNAKVSPQPLGFLSQANSTLPPAPAPQMTQGQRMGAAAGYGLSAAGKVPASTDTGEALVGVLGATATGAAMGTSVAPGVGTAIGAGVGLLMGGLNAWMGSRAARRERDSINAQRREVDRLQKAELAKDEHWRNINRLDTLEQARYERRKFAMSEAYAKSEAQGKKLLALSQSNQNLRDRYAKMGYV